jgi:phosphoribosyl-AMP cyclohydrolase
MTEGLKLTEDGLVAAIAQDAASGRVLMFAWMNAEALRKTCETGLMHYWSRSRKKLWLKGETSGHTQRVVRWYRDCDGDALLFKVEQTGGACHTGYASCFFQELDRDGKPLPVDETPAFDPGATYAAR